MRAELLEWGSQPYGAAQGMVDGAPSYVRGLSEPSLPYGKTRL